MFCHFENANICWPSPRSRSRARGRSCPGCWRTVDGGLVDEGVASFRGQDPPPLHVEAYVGVGAQRSTGWPPHPDRCLPPPRSTPGSSDPLINTHMVLRLDTRHTMTDYQHFRPTIWRLKLHPQAKCRWNARKATEPRCLDAGVWLRAEQAGAGGIGIHSWENRDSLIKRYLIEQRCQIDTNQYLPIECAP